MSVEENTRSDIIQIENHRWFGVLQLLIEPQDKGLQWFGHVEKTVRRSITRRVLVIQFNAKNDHGTTKNEMVQPDTRRY
jgi:hypothetical protein